MSLPVLRASHAPDPPLQRPGRAREPPRCGEAQAAFGQAGITAHRLFATFRLLSLPPSLLSLFPARPSSQLFLYGPCSQM